MPASPYTDLDRPPLDVRALRRALLVPGGLWTRLELHAETDSTNADVAAAARDGEPAGLIVVAERQRAGRGRLGRGWESPARAGLAVSVLLRPGVPEPERGWLPVPVTGYGWLPLLAGVALVDAVARVAELTAALKWPNDLLVRPADAADGGAEAKCAGILAETVPVEPGAASAGRPPAALSGKPPAALSGKPPAVPGWKPPGVPAGSVGAAAGRPPGAPGGGAPAVVLGIGLNVTLRASELPVNPTGLPATSLALAGAVVTDRDPLLRALLRQLAGWYDRWRTAGGDAEACGLREAYLGRCATIGRTVRVLLPDGSDWRGEARTVDGDGRLVVVTPDGQRSVAAGDVLHLR